MTYALTKQVCQLNEQNIYVGDKSQQTYLLWRRMMAFI